MEIHPNDQLLEEFLLSLDDKDRALMRHLAGCDVCRSRLFSLPRSALRRAEGNPELRFEEVEK